MPLKVHGATSTFAETLRESQDFCKGALQKRLNVWAHEILHLETVGSDITERLCQELVMTAV
jgi:hypothetical protein